MSAIRYLTSFIMVKEGFPFVFGTILIAAIFAVFQIWIGVAVFIFLAFFMAYFFRDPRRTVPGEAGIIVSAADGRVTRVEENENGKVVSVFLSPLDVHINRAPIAGRIRKIEYIRGKKNPATSDQASLINERNSLTIEGEKMTVVCTQIAGIVARRIVCWSKEGDTLELGEKFGLIKFSSRTDLLMPKNVEVLVKIGDRVVGGETVIGRLLEYSPAEITAENDLPAQRQQPATS
ncbi:MAG: phosphatidylserine decarboxylase precursor-related protein [Acidobacteria bacterium]|jgi:phosphatidylserine decarboxylase|nr:phosphatidylserine decarboxylase precursor-related protein [Acidobacteriota bacterium]